MEEVASGWWACSCEETCAVLEPFQVWPDPGGKTCCPKTDSAPSLPHFNTASVHKSSHKIPGSFDILNSILSKNLLVAQGWI